MARLEIPVEQYVEDYGVGVPALLAMIAIGLVYSIRPAITVGGGMYGRLGVSVIAILAITCIWLSGLAYAHADPHDWFDDDDTPNLESDPADLVEEAES